MATNEILPFATDGGANVLSQSAYAADSQRLIGNQPGIARAQLNNKLMRQVSAIVAGFGQFLAARQATNITDSLTPTQVETAIQAALESHGTLPAGNIVAAGPQVTWSRKSSDGWIEQGISGISVPSGGGFTDVTFPVAFSTVVLDIQCCAAGAATDQVGWLNATLTGCRVLTGNLDSSARIVNIVARGY